MLRAAHELDAGEQRDAAGQQHGEATHLHVPVLAGGRPGLVPPDERPAPGRVVDVVEEATLGHQERIRLERAFWKQGGKPIVVAVCRLVSRENSGGARF